MVVEGYILLSLLLHTILVLFGPLRKRTRDGLLLSMISSAQLQVDRAASLILALISTSRQQNNCTDYLWYYEDIKALWVPFLLLHLGGSDIITVSPLEENNALWMRYIFVVLNQVLASRFVILSYGYGNKFKVAIILLFVAGTIKYGERTRALYLTNRNRFRESLLKEPDPGPNYAKIMEEYTSLNEVNLPIQIKMAPEINEVSKVACCAKNEDEFDDLAVVNHAFHFFEIFKGLIVDHIFSFREREYSREFFLKRSSGDAFRVLATELNFIYGILYTKVVVYSGFGCVLRIISSSAVIAAFFIFKSEIDYFFSVDALVTFILFCGAIGLDAIALFMFACSDWTLAHMQKFSRDRNWKAAIARCFLVIQRYFLTLKRTNWRTITNTECQKRRVLFRRWSESLQTFNLIDYCLKDLPWTKFTIVDHFCSKLIEGMDLKNFYNSIKYISQKPLPKEVWDSVFNELKANSTPTYDVDIAKGRGSTRDEWILRHSNWHIDNDQSIYCKLMPYIDYDESIIIWHIATDLCYTTDDLKNSDLIRREICKILSDYMLFLIVMHPTMMLAVARIAHIIFRDTSAEAKKFFNSKKFGEKKQEKEHEWACKMILSVNTEVEPIKIKGDRSKSVLFDACILAKELKKLDGQTRWKLMNEVWVKLLLYAASHCKATIHVAQLGKGGEFLTFVWLLMAHFGLGDHFERKQGQPGAKLIVGK